MNTVPTGRFAPSPTGRMHLGNVFAALMSWLSARSKGGRWILRIEDLDPGRSRPEYARQIEEDLLWLGLDWEEGGTDGTGCHGPYVQSLRGDIYARYFDALHARGVVYPCNCTRADIMATQAPHRSDGAVVYAGTCRPAAGARYDTSRLERPHSWRIQVPDSEITVDDMVAGKVTFNLAREMGDTVVRRSDGAWAYQLAVAVDDALMGVTEVVRGCDLLPSAALQTHILRQLDLPVPRYGHLPLLTDSTGRRLSKRDASLAMDALRREFSADALVGRIAYTAGLRPTPEPVSPRALAVGFDLAALAGKQTIAVI